MFYQKTQPKTRIMRITGINIPDDQRIAYSLTLIYGIGRVNVFTVLKSAKIDPDKRVKDLTKEEKTLLDTFIKIPRDKARDAMLNYLSIIAHQDIVKRIYKEAKANYKKGILPKTDDLC